jgi:hypothetical protein
MTDQALMADYSNLVGLPLTPATTGPVLANWPTRVGEDRMIAGDARP